MPKNRVADASISLYWQPSLKMWVLVGMPAGSDRPVTRKAKTTTPVDRYTMVQLLDAVQQGLELQLPFERAER